MLKAAEGKRLAIIAWAKDAEGKDDVAVFAGVLRLGAIGYVLEREGGDFSFQIQEEWLPRIKAVPEELRQTLLGAEYQLSLSVSSAEAEVGPLITTSLKWPRA